MSFYVNMKQRRMVGTALVGTAIAFGSSPALADCLPDAAGTTVICNSTDPDGFSSTASGVTIRVEPVTIVGTGATTPSPLLSAGSTSILNNEGTIISGADAIALGGGSTVNNAAGGFSGNIIGNVVFGATTGAQVNTFNNLGGTASLTGNISSAGVLTVNNASGTTIAGNISSAGALTVNNSGSINGAINGSAGADSVSITNGGVVTGAIALGAGDDTLNIGTGTSYTGNIDFAGGNNTLINAGILNSNVTAADGNDTITNSGTLNGNIDLGTGADTINGLAGTGTVNKAGSGVLTLTGNNSGFSNAGTVLTIANGGTVSIAASTNMLTGGVSMNGGTLNITGPVTLANNFMLGAGGGTFDTAAATTLNGVISGAGGLTKIGTGNLTLGGANSYAGGTTITAGTLTGTATSLQGNIVNNAALVFDQSTTGTYAGNLSGTGTVTKTGVGTTTLSGVNSYSGATFVLGGILAVGPTGIGDTSAVTVNAPGTLKLNANETIGSLAGNGALTGAFTLTTGGNQGSTTFSGPIAITGLTKVGTGTFNLTGTGALTNGIAVNAGTLTVGGAYSSPTNAIASGATLNVLLAGALTGNIAAVAGSTTVVNGTVTGNVGNAGALSGTGTVNGSLVNNGTLNPGNAGIGIFNVNGAYSQGPTGVLSVEITPNTVAGTGYDRLSVRGLPGTAGLGGTLAVSLANGLGTPAGPYVEGNIYDVVTATGGVSGSFLVTGNTLSPFVRLAPTGIVGLGGTAQAYRLTVVRTPYATGIGTDATPNQIAVASGFQALVPGATGDTAALVAGVDAMTAAEAQLFFDQASPEPYGAYARSLLNTGNLFSRQVHLQAQQRSNSQDGFDVWARGYALWGSGEGKDYRYGSHLDTGGIAIGGTYSSDNYYVGAAFGLSKDNVDYDLNNSDGDNKSWQFGVFGGYNFGGGFDVTLQIDYTHANIGASRTISVGSISRVAEGDTNGHSWKIVPTVGYQFDLAGMQLRPFLGLDYTSGNVDGFTEEGAGAANLTIEDIDADRTDLLVGLDLKSDPNAKFSPYGYLAWRHQIDNAHDTMTAHFVDNVNSSFDVRAVTPRKDQIDLDAGLNYQSSPQLAFFGGYQGTFRKDLDSHGFSVGLRYSFGGNAQASSTPN